jgi:hypothetical protein
VRDNSATWEPLPVHRVFFAGGTMEGFMDGIIYLIGLIVVIMAILSFLGLR